MTTATEPDRSKTQSEGRHLAATPARRLRRRIRHVLMLVTAAAVVLMIALPASTWQAPVDDFAMRGFDPTLMYSAGENGSSVALQPGAAALVTQPGGTTLLHLVSSPLSFESDFDLVVQQTAEGAEPTTVALTSPYLNQELRLSFAGDGSVSQERVADGRVVDRQVLGTYEGGQPYHVAVRLDRDQRTASLTLRPKGGLSGAAISLTSSPEAFESHAVVRRLVSVQPGRRYQLSTRVVPSAAGLAGLSIAWYDRDRRRLDLESSWARVGSNAAEPVTRVLNAEAPAGAAYAEPEVAVSASGASAFSAIALTEAGSQENLIPNAAGGLSAAAWKRAEGAQNLTVLDFTTRTLTASATARGFPRLFSSLRMALTVENAGGTAVTRLQLANYRLDVPHQRWLATRVTGTPVRAISLSLAALALLLLADELWDRRSWVQRLARRMRRARPRIGPTTLPLVLAIGVYFALNLVMSSLGSLNADSIGARVWTYIAALHGPGELYFMPNVSSAEAVQWQGEALQEAGFPYGPTMAYVVSALAAIWRFGIHQAALPVPDAIAIDTLVRLANAVFGLIAAGLVAAIASSLGASRRSSLTIAAIFLFAPALTIASAVWATTQTMSMVFLLGAVLAILRGSPTVAWVLLAATMMTRPQNLVSALVIAVWLIAATPRRITMRSLTIALLVVFPLLLPITLTTAPSLPVDVMVNALFLHVGNGNDAWTVPVSWGAPGPWTLVETVFGHASGVNAMLYPAETPLLGGLTYFQLGSLAFGGFLLALILVAILRRRSLARHGGFILLGTVAVLGLLQLKTGAPTYHMMQPTALAFLLFGVLGRRLYVYVVSVLSVTTAWSMLALGVYWLSHHPQWSTGLFRPDTALAQALLWSVESGWVVAAMCAANTSVLLILSLRVFAPRVPHFAVGLRRIRMPSIRPQRTNAVSAEAGS